MTEDFVKHINAKQGVRGSQNEDSREEEEEEEGDQFIPSAEQLVGFLPALRLFYIAFFRLVYKCY